MEFNYTDIPVSDPFLSLETNLEDITDSADFTHGANAGVWQATAVPMVNFPYRTHFSIVDEEATYDVIRMDAQDNLSMDTSSWNGDHQQQPQTSHFPYAKPFHRPTQHSPPQDYYDPNRFSPPNFDSSLHIDGGPAAMLPKLGSNLTPLQLGHYQPNSLVGVFIFSKT
ncbi:unnamed protein product [Heligmosomoides polygyrus]|uniref:NAC domain-containing protein n=1 Tax=Heligmosomoides polygyrus TaxID=6339 RepID=A0A183FMZ6_HELPZ|nr:unnamed protein product [Heligmosomoides polygyrus]